MYIYNSRNEFFKKPFGAVKETTAVNFTVLADRGENPPVLCIAKEGEAEKHITLAQTGQQDGKCIFSACFAPEKTGLHFYRFQVYNGQYIYNDLKGVGIVSGEGEKFQLTVYNKNFFTPQRFKGGIIYQIFPDRFYEEEPKKQLFFKDRIYRQNKSGQPYFYPNEQADGYLNKDYYGGDLKGIISKLDYIESLGTSCIYLNPIFEAHSNHRYNTADYMKIDPDLGTLDDFHSLCELAHRRGIKIILDGVFSHTGSDSIYFNRQGRYGKGGAFNDENSPYRPWFDFDKKYKSGYRAWWDFDTLPEVDENNKQYSDYICGENGVVDYWLKNGADGFRLDVADELPDSFIEKLRVAVKRCGEEKILIGEVWEDATTKVSFDERRTYLLGKGLDSTMNYPFRLCVLDFIKNGDGQKLCEAVYSIYENYPREAMDCAWNNLSTHDTPRAATFLCGEDPDGTDRYWQDNRRLSDEAYEKARKMLVCAYAVLFGLPGIPCVYYGDEIGMEGYRDPFNRGYFTWWNMDKYILDNIRSMGAFRKGNSVFAQGKIYFVHISFDTVAFVRFDEEHEVLIAVNRGENDESFTYKDVSYTVLAKSFINAKIK